MNWLKDKPLIQIFLTFLLNFFVVLYMFHYTGRTEDTASIHSEIETIKIEKAPYSYVDKQDDKLRKELESKADKTTVESMDSKLDIIISRLR